MRVKGKIFARIFIVIFYVIITYLLIKIDFRKFINVFSQLRLLACLKIVSLFAVSFYLVAARSYLAYRQFNVPISYKAAKDALFASLLGGVIPIFGAVLSQSHSLHTSSSVSVTTSSVMYFYDKCVMAFSGLIFSLFAIHTLFFNVSILEYFTYGVDYFSTSIAMLEFVLALVLAFLSVYFTALPKRDKQILHKYVSLRNLSFLAMELLLSMAIWLISASSFVVAMQAINPAVTYGGAKLLGASVIISFISSMPISVNGWGIREFAAISIFGVLLIQAEHSLAAALLVGAFSTISLAVILVAQELFDLITWKKIEFNTK